jgi:hypothetical protein
MKKIFTLFFIFTTLFLQAATYRTYIGHSVSGSTYTVWVNSDTQIGENVVGQICNNGGSPYTGFVSGTYNNTTVAGANWKIVITITTQSPPKLELANTNSGGSVYGYTGCNITLSAVLPIELSDFKAVSINNTVKLGWTTTLEVGSSTFNIQRSPNSQTWQTIGSVKAANSASGAKYNFADDAPLSTTSYYRLQMIDNDGKMDYSKIISISNNANKKALAVYPNPAKTELNLVTDGNTEGVTIMDLTGRTVRQFNGNSAKVNIADLPNGVYFVRLLDKNGLASEPARFVKQ